MEKLKVTKEVFESLEVAKVFNSTENIIKEHIKCDNDWEYGCKGINGMDIFDLCKALFVGYELEKTPEEKILESYKKAVELLDTKSTLLPEGYMEGTKDCTEFILDTLGIKIKGINE